jgi:hypothetical protein
MSNPKAHKSVSANAHWTLPGLSGLFCNNLHSTRAPYPLEETFGLIPAVFLRHRNVGMEILLQPQCEIAHGSLAWHEEKGIGSFSKIIYTLHPLLTHHLGFVDGLHLRIAIAQTLQVENASDNRGAQTAFILFSTFL